MGACCLKPSGADEDSRPHPASGLARGGDGPGPGNKLLCRKPPKWDADAPMTHGQLLSKRDEFWETAPAFTGRAEVWQALRAAAECEDQDTAQAILDAIQVTLPHGNMSVVYDELGNRYDLPPYCLSEPSNMVHGGGAEAGQHSIGGDGEASGSTPDGAAEVSEINVRLRLSTGSELAWSGAQTTSIGVLKVHIATEEGIAVGRQRFLFGGKLLQDAQTLAKVGVKDDAVVQIMVRPEDLE